MLAPLCGARSRGPADDDLKLSPRREASGLALRETDPRVEPQTEVLEYGGEITPPVEVSEAGRVHGSRRLRQDRLPVAAYLLFTAQPLRAEAREFGVETRLIVEAGTV